MKQFLILDNYEPSKKNEQSYYQNNGGFSQWSPDHRVTTAPPSKLFNDSSNNSSTSVHYNYTVTLRLPPVEHGIKCYSFPWHAHQFTGISAFNYYFKYLLPDKDGFSLPDVWDGYFHVTLAKFRFDPRDELAEKENYLVKYIKSTTLRQAFFGTIFPCKFKSDGLNICSGAGRFGDMKDVDFVTLKVMDLDNTINKIAVS
jgi:hypothetical protein